MKLFGEGSCRLISWALQVVGVAWACTILLSMLLTTRTRLQVHAYGASGSSMSCYFEPGVVTLMQLVGNLLDLQTLDLCQSSSKNWSQHSYEQLDKLKAHIAHQSSIPTLVRSQMSRARDPSVLQVLI